MRIIKTIADLRSIPLQQEWIGYDLEFSGLDVRKGTLLLMSITTSEETYVIDCTTLSKQELQYLRPLLTNTLCIGANITIDFKYTLHHVDIELQHMSDVMVNEQILTAGKFVPSNNGKPFSLQAIAYRRLGKSLNKDVREEFIHYTGTLSDEAYLYAAEDTQVLYPILQQQLQELQKEELQETYNLECTLLPVTAYMEYTGVPINIEHLRALNEPFEELVRRSEKVLQDLFITKGAANHIVFSDNYSCVNLNSKPQVIQAFNALGIDVDSLAEKKLVKWDFKNRKKKDNISLEQIIHDDESDILEAIDKFGGYENEVLRAYAFNIGAQKILNTYVIGFQKRYDEDTKRIYPWFKQLGARSTGRYSSDFQQTPKDEKLQRLGINASIRQSVQTQKGRRLLIADYSAIELVILAELSKDERLEYEILNGDVHLVVSREVMGTFFPQAREMTDENKKKHPFSLFRDFSKTLSYGIAYGVTGMSLSDQAMAKLGALSLKLTPDEGDHAVELWKKSFSKAGKFLNESANMAVTKGYTTSVTGRKRYFDLQHIAENKWRFLAAKREGSNQRIQSTSADMTKRAMLYCFQELDKGKARIILSVHDELVIESTMSYTENAARIMKQGMERAARELLPRLGHTVIIDPSISERYDK